jgi:hypothetical protein
MRQSEIVLAMREINVRAESKGSRTDRRGLSTNMQTYIRKLSPEKRFDLALDRLRQTLAQAVGPQSKQRGR